jgi:hypothetical protein
MSDKRPPLGRFGGVRMVQRRIGRSETLHQHKEAVAAELIALGTANITDIVNLDGTIKDFDDIPEHALRAIKKISVRGDDVTIEMHDKVSVLRVLAKASGMLDQEQNEDKPSIVGINIKGPDEPLTTTYEEKDYEESEGSFSPGGGGAGTEDDPGEHQPEGNGPEDGAS